MRIVSISDDCFEYIKNYLYSGYKCAKDFYEEILLAYNLGELKKEEEYMLSIYKERMLKAWDALAAFDPEVLD